MPLTYKQVEAIIISRIHIRVDNEYHAAQVRIASFCRIESGDLSKRFGLSEEQQWDLVKACDTEARKWSKAIIQEWAKE